MSTDLPRFIAFGKERYDRGRALSDGRSWNWFQMGLRFSLSPRFPIPAPLPPPRQPRKTKQRLWSRSGSLDSGGEPLRDPGVLGLPSFCRTGSLGTTSRRRRGAEELLVLGSGVTALARPAYTWTKRFQPRPPNPQRLVQGGRVLTSYINYIYTILYYIKLYYIRLYWIMLYYIIINIILLNWSLRFIFMWITLSCMIWYEKVLFNESLLSLVLKASDMCQ